MFAAGKTSALPAVTQAQAVDFDGTNDYLSRASDLVGNTTSKTFTFSAWVWPANTVTTYVYRASGSGSAYFQITLLSTGLLEIDGTQSTGGNIITIRVTLDQNARLNTFFHLLVSIDLANTSNRSVYINDILQTLTVTTYVNNYIYFTQPNHNVTGFTGSYGKGRFSNVFLDYTYRDLSVTANRRLFVTADLKPASGQAALNPILYLPMNDPTAPGTNAGTGGNFTLTGTVARSGRGPNQYNAPYSDLDGTADYLSRTSVTGIADGTTFTASFVVNPDALSNSDILHIGSTDGLSDALMIRLFSNALEVTGYNDVGAGGTVVFKLTTAATFVAGRNYHCVLSIDLTSTSKRFLYVNGESVSPTWNTYNTAGTFNFLIASNPRTSVGASPATTPARYLNGRLGDVWFNTSYIDLSVASNLAKFVTGTGIDAKPVDLGASGELPTGTSPLIYLPLYGNNAGKNYGTGGDFTVNSGPYTGARGPNEFWGNKADFDGTTGYLARTSALSGVADGKTFSCSFWLTDDIATTQHPVISIGDSTTGVRLYIARNASDQLQIQARNAANTTILDASTTAIAGAATPVYVQLMVDLASASNRAVYVNGTANSVTWSTYTNDTIDFDGSSRITIGANWTGTVYNQFLNGKIAELYFTTDYIDFSQEANRLKFRDAFGNPTDLPAAIAAQSIPNPAIYMRFDPASFGTNSGTGGNFTVNGTISDGGQL